MTDAVVLDRWAPPVADAAVDWCRSWLQDPLERVLLVAVVLVSACLLLVLASRQDAAAASADDACVARTVDEARAFAQVLGDQRPVRLSFAEQACAG